MRKFVPNVRLRFFPIFTVLFFVFIFFLLLYNSFGYLDPDLGWHLQAGRYVLETGEAPLSNQYNYPLAGKEWVDHEWFLDAGTYFLYENLGYIWVNIFFALLMVATLVLLYRSTLHIFENGRGAEVPAMLFILFGTVAIFPHAGVRMQEISLLGLLILLILLYRAERTGKIKGLLWVIPLFWMWANMHGGFLLGLFLLFSYGVIKAGELWIYTRYRPRFLDFNRVLSARAIVKYFLVSLLGAGATLLTPYGFRLYGFLSGYSNTFYLTHIREWLPQYFPPLNYWQVVYIGIVSVALLLTLIYATYNKEKHYRIDIWKTFLTILLLALAVKSRRHFPLLFIASFPFVVYFHSVFFGWKKNPLRAKMPAAIKIYLIAVLMAGSAYVATATDFTEEPFSSHCYKYPCEAVSFLKERPQYHDLRMFNHYGWGGYLIHTYSQGRLFIDGRLPQYEINESTMLEEYYGFFEPGKVREMLDKYKVELVLFKKSKQEDNYDKLEESLFFINEEELQPKSQKLIKTLSSDEDWRLIFESDVSLIFLKTGH